jgi:hypothetical protein
MGCSLLSCVYRGKRSVHSGKGHKPSSAYLMGITLHHLTNLCDDVITYKRRTFLGLLDPVVLSLHTRTSQVVRSHICVIAVNSICNSFVGGRLDTRVRLAFCRGYFDTITRRSPCALLPDLGIILLHQNIYEICFFSTKEELY